MPVSKLRGTVRVEGLDTLLNKLRAADPIYARPWKKALLQAVHIASAEARVRSPRMTGTLSGSITSRLDPKPVPFWGIVTAGAENKGFRYPFALEAGKGKKRSDGTNSITHYRSGSRAGQSTKRWFKGSLAAVRQTINGLLSAAAREVESAWGR